MWPCYFHLCWYFSYKGLCIYLCNYLLLLATDTTLQVVVWSGRAQGGICWNICCVCFSIFLRVFVSVCLCKYLCTYLLSQATDRWLGVGRWPNRWHKVPRLWKPSLFPSCCCTYICTALLYEYMICTYTYICISLLSNMNIWYIHLHLYMHCSPI